MPESRPHILVVDDEPSIREALTAALEPTYTVHAAATAAEACAILGRHPIAVIVLDILLGQEHGLNLIDSFRAISNARILILTAYSTEELAIQAVRVKADDYLRKPINIRDLRAAVARQLQPEHPRPDPIARARHLVSEHPDRPHTTASLAREVGLSERHLVRQFRETYGKTPRRYLTEVRMQHAASQLRTTDRGIEQIAQAVGYRNVAAFDRTFKRAFGVTPSEWRTGGGPLPPRKSPA